MGLKEGKTRFTFSVSDQVGVLHEITGVFKDLNINISSLASYTTDEGPGNSRLSGSMRKTPVN